MEPANLWEELVCSFHSFKKDVKLLIEVLFRTVSDVVISPYALVFGMLLPFAVAIIPVIVFLASCYIAESMLGYIPQVLDNIIHNATLWKALISIFLVFCLPKAVHSAVQEKQEAIDREESAKIQAIMSIVKSTANELTDETSPKNRFYVSDYFRDNEESILSGIEKALRKSGDMNDEDTAKGNVERTVILLVAFLIYLIWTIL